MGCEMIPPSNTAEPDGVKPENTAKISKIESQQVSIAQIFSNLDKYNGKIVTFDGYLFSGWEWFGIAEDYEYDRVVKSKGEWINIVGEPSVKVNQEDIRRNIEEIREQLYVASSGAPRSLFGKVRITGEFQLIGDNRKWKQVAPIVIELLPWIPPQGSTAPAVEGKLTLSDSPILDKPIQVIYTYWMPERSMWDTADASANIEIPDTFELVEGALQWQGILEKGIKMELRATIKAVKKGTCEITAKTSFPPSSSLEYGNSRTDKIYTLILSDRGFFSSRQADLPGESNGIQYAVPVPTSEDVVISLDLSLPHPPPLGKTAELTLTATAMIDAPGARIDIQLPDALSLVSGDLMWAGDMVKGDRIELKATVKATAMGKWTIFGSAQYSPTPKSGRALPAYVMILYVFKDGADTLKMPPPEPLLKLNVNLSLSKPPASTEAYFTTKVHKAGRAGLELATP